jgi:hypothetical protein
MLILPSSLFILPSQPIGLPLYYAVQELGGAVIGLIGKVNTPLCTRLGDEGDR